MVWQSFFCLFTTSGLPTIRPLISFGAAACVGLGRAVGDKLYASGHFHDACDTISEPMGRFQGATAGVGLGWDLCERAKGSTILASGVPPCWGLWYL